MWLYNRAEFASMCGPNRVEIGVKCGIYLVIIRISHWEAKFENFNYEKCRTFILTLDLVL